MSSGGVHRSHTALPRKRTNAQTLKRTTHTRTMYSAQRVAYSVAQHKDEANIAASLCV
jgi:hypothetical protein